MSSLPPLSSEQRAAALEKAAEVRKARAELKDQLKSGKTSLAEVLGRAEDDVVGKLKVSAVLQAMPGIGKIRGVDSRGMLVSEFELQISDDHEGIIELPADAPVGTSFADYAGLDDAMFDVAITPNRQDCMGVRGIARDLAAALRDSAA